MKMKTNKKINSKKIILISIIFLILLAITVFVSCIVILEKKNSNKEISKLTNNMGIIANVEEEEAIVVPMNDESEGVIEEQEEVEQNEEENNTKEQSKNEVKSTTNVSSNSTYYIKINVSENVLTIYTKDENGDYTKPVKAMVCSTGRATPKSGKYKITSYRREWNGLQGNVYGQYATQIIGNILFHSVPYTIRNDNSSLEWWEYDKLGTSASLRLH